MSKISTYDLIRLPANPNKPPVHSPLLVVLYLPQRPYLHVGGVEAKVCGLGRYDGRVVAPHHQHKIVQAQHVGPVGCAPRHSLTIDVRQKVRC